MAHIEKTVEIGRPVAAVYRHWAECEEFPRFLDGLKEMGLAETHLRWRAEVLTFAPKGKGTRLTLRIDYDAIGANVERALESVSRRVQRDLELFRSFAEGSGGPQGKWLFARPQASHA